MIEFKNVVKDYGNGVLGADHLSVRINQGDFVYVVGPSGAGKSTFIKLMYHDLTATSGEIRVNNYNVAAITNKEIPFLRRELGIVFQDFKLLPRLTIFENIAYALQVIEKQPEEVEKRVNEVLKLVGLSDKAQNFPNEISGGEQQRVAIARAIANRPGILIADEPTGNLDPDTSEEIINILENINQDGTTIVMATHNSNMVNEHKHRVLEISAGKLTRDQEGGVYENE
ncbi:cell division protein FtsE [Ligilactobacillus salitolerans]|uniref:Cell division ATP-binding protein FtsE n=1 Tax=Ligilactobacillus salitolerans TaxID=1808352 RepID=A0A401IW69_9LACO|nr:cell division ATP-binding protein FtsE [Ligilactobacillus salitolerans]GBG95758.1 cell division protein FtsE [Ligilactobacillus salitolerans]